MYCRIPHSKVLFVCYTEADQAHSNIISAFQNTIKQMYRNANLEKSQSGSSYVFKYSFVLNLVVIDKALIFQARLPFTQHMSLVIYIKKQTGFSYNQFYLF